MSTHTHTHIQRDINGYTHRNVIIHIINFTYEYCNISMCVCIDECRTTYIRLDVSPSLKLFEFARFYKLVNKKNFKFLYPEKPNNVEGSCCAFMSKLFIACAHLCRSSISIFTYSRHYAVICVQPLNRLDDKLSGFNQLSDDD